MEDCLKRLLTDKKEEKRSGGLDLLLRLSKREEKAAFFARVKQLADLDFTTRMQKKKLSCQRPKQRPCSSM